VSFKYLAVFIDRPEFAFEFSSWGVGFYVYVLGVYIRIGRI
jgi:hypothetical protein